MVQCCFLSYHATYTSRTCQVYPELPSMVKCVVIWPPAKLHLNYYVQRQVVTGHIYTVSFTWLTFLKYNQKQTFNTLYFILQLRVLSINSNSVSVYSSDVIFTVFLILLTFILLFFTSLLVAVFCVDSRFLYTTLKIYIFYIFRMIVLSSNFI